MVSSLYMRQANLKLTLEFCYSTFLSWQVFTREISMYCLTARKSSCCAQNMASREPTAKSGMIGKRVVYVCVCFFVHKNHQI